MLKILDIFGAEYPFRANNKKYEKYPSKTGGILFLIYLFGIIFYVSYGINNYFEHPEYETFFYEENILMEGIDLLNDGYTFVFAKQFLNTNFTPGQITSDFADLFNPNKSKGNMPFNTCTEKNFNFNKKDNYYGRGKFGNLSISDLQNYLCPNISDIPPINGNERSYLINMLINLNETLLDNQNPLNNFMEFLQPINTLNSQGRHQVLDTYTFTPKKGLYQLTEINLKKEKIIVDNEILFGKNERRI